MYNEIISREYSSTRIKEGHSLAQNERLLSSIGEKPARNGDDQIAIYTLVLKLSAVIQLFIA